MDIWDEVARNKFPTVIESLIQIIEDMGHSRRQFTKQQQQYTNLKKRREYWLGIGILPSGGKQ